MNRNRPWDELRAAVVSYALNAGRRASPDQVGAEAQQAIDEAIACCQVILEDRAALLAEALDKMGVGD